MTIYFLSAHTKEYRVVYNTVVLPFTSLLSLHDKHSISLVRRSFLLFIHPAKIIKAISSMSTDTDEISSADLIWWLILLWSLRKIQRLKLFIGFVPELFPVVASLVSMFMPQPVLL